MPSHASRSRVAAPVPPGTAAPPGAASAAAVPALHVPPRSRRPPCPPSSVRPPPPGALPPGSLSSCWGGAKSRCDIWVIECSAGISPARVCGATKRTPNQPNAHKQITLCQSTATPSHLRSTILRNGSWRASWVWGSPPAARPAPLLRGSFSSFSSSTPPWVEVRTRPSASSGVRVRDLSAVHGSAARVMTGGWSREALTGRL